MFTRILGTMTSLGILVATACTAPMDTLGTDDASAVLSVVPANGTEGVDPTQPIVIRFNRTMMSGTEMLVLLHERTVTGPVVPGRFDWSADRTTLTFFPAARLAARSVYVVHLAPDLRLGSGERLNHGSCTRLGGRSVTGAMMGSGGMSGAGMGAGMMGAGWSPVGGSHGMMFQFVTS
jgi:hypothetical protein